MTRIRIVQASEQHSRGEEAPQQPIKPLTHHEILGLMAPFTQRGRHADLAASQRVDRRLALKPVEHAPADQRPLRLLERLVLEVPEDAPLKLVRSIEETSGLTSTVTAIGDNAAKLLDLIERVPVQRQFALHAGIPVSRSYLVTEAKSGHEDGAPRAQIEITEARARVHGIELAFKADRFVGHAVDLRLTADAGSTLKIPEDLTAVIGWKWRPLREFVSLWRGSIRVRSKEPRRTPDIEAKIGQTIVHLARTLERPPSDFHPRYKRARWRVSFQRGIPLGVGLVLIALTPGIRWLDMEDNSILRMLIFHAPPFMLAAMFMMREMPRIEIPPIPRPLSNDTWIVRVADKGRTSRPRPSPAEV